MARQPRSDVQATCQPPKFECGVAQETTIRPGRDAGYGHRASHPRHFSEFRFYPIPIAEALTWLRSYVNPKMSAAMQCQRRFCHAWPSLTDAVNDPSPPTTMRKLSSRPAGGTDVLLPENGLACRRLSSSRRTTQIFCLLIGLSRPNVVLRSSCLSPPIAKDRCDTLRFSAFGPLFTKRTSETRKSHG